jgi:serine carboxypeptidase-like clade 2
VLHTCKPRDIFVMNRQVWHCSHLILIVLALQNGASFAAPAANLISNLPGQPKVDFNQYAGYISVGEKHDRKLFYYFVEAQNSSAGKPLVLWLNGGPISAQCHA